MGMLVAQYPWRPSLVISPDGQRKDIPTSATRTNSVPLVTRITKSFFEYDREIT